MEPYRSMVGRRIYPCQREMGKRFLRKMKTNFITFLWKPSQALFIFKTLSINVLIRPILYDRGAKLR